MLPSRGWQSYEDALRRVGERRPPAKGDDSLVAFLVVLGLLRPDRVTLSEPGQAYFNARFITGDGQAADAVLHGCVMDHPPVTAVAQLLAGVPGADRGRVETVLRNQGFEGVTDRSVGSLLKLMHRAGVVEYNTRTAAVRVLASPVTAADDAVPTSVYISPATPYGNKVWLRRVLSECRGSIDWLDKHFMPAAFEPLWEAVDGARVSRVRILSLRLKDHEGKRTMKQYRDLRAELAGRSVDLEWRTIDSTKIRDTHDRWVIGANTARNVPNVNAIYTGQYSEMHASTQRAELSRLYDDYWSDAVPFDPVQVPSVAWSARQTALIPPLPGLSVAPLLTGMHSTGVFISDLLVHVQPSNSLGVALDTGAALAPAASSAAYSASSACTCGTITPERTPGWNESISSSVCRGSWRRRSGRNSSARRVCPACPKPRSTDELLSR